MNKITLLLAFLLFSPFVKAETVTLSFSEIPVVKFAEATYKSILRHDYVLSPSIINTPEKITLSVTTPKENLPSLLKDVLLAAGISVEERDGVFWLDRLTSSSPQAFPIASDDSPMISPVSTVPDAGTVVDSLRSNQTTPQEVYLYQPLFRKPEELQKIAGGIVNVVIGEDCLILHSDTNKVRLAQALLHEYDRKRDEVLAKVTVVEYATDNDNGAGFFGALHLLGQKLNMQVGDQGILGNFVSFKNSTLEAVLSVISQDSRFHVLSTSKLRITSGKTGRLSVGQEVPTLGKNDYDREGNAIQSVFYREAGLIVNLTPVIVRDSVYSDITHEVSNFSVTKTSNIDSPSISKRSFSTSFTSDFNEIVFLGGLDEQKENEANSGLFGFRFSQQKIESKTILFLVIEYERV